MKVAFSREAESQVGQIDAWWREHRDAAPDRFAMELEEAILTLETSPVTGVLYEERPPVRRLLLRRTHYHLYFVVDGETVTVVAVWSAFRGSGPPL